jgi:hypothetical protein
LATCWQRATSNETVRQVKQQLLFVGSALLLEHKVFVDVLCQ